MRNLVIGSCLLSLAGSIWGGMFIAVRLAIFVIPPVPLVWMRYGTALLALTILMVITHSSWHIDKKDCKLLLLSALSGQVLSIVTQETGTMMTSAQTGSVITAATPAFMVVFGYVLLHENSRQGGSSPSFSPRSAFCSSSWIRITLISIRSEDSRCSWQPSHGPSCRSS